MTVEELIKGNYYDISWGRGHIVVKHVNGRSEHDRFLCADNKQYQVSSYCTGLPSEYIVRDATPEEIIHLDACIVAGKWVPKPEFITPQINDSYEI